jgi:hypothetical protein
MKPNIDDYPTKISGYILPVIEVTVLEALHHSKLRLLKTIQTISEEKSNFAYAENKWTIKELILHCVDTERLFAFRALMFARGETQKALAFDENEYAKNSNASNRTLKSIIEEYEAVNTATVVLFKNFSNHQLSKKGEMPSGFITVNALGYAICGHLQHHLSVLTERYLK